MIKILMDVALRVRLVVVGAAVLLAIAGIYSFRELDIEAYPDPVQPRVEIITQPLGLSAEEVEKIATIPLEVGLAGIRNLEAMRTISLFGLSDVKLYFTWDSDYYWDQVETINRLGLVTLPQISRPRYRRTIRSAKSTVISYKARTIISLRKRRSKTGYSKSSLRQCQGSKMCRASAA